MRTVVFLGGFWIALLLAPTVVHKVGLQWWGLVLFALITAMFFYQDLLLIGLQATPMQDVERFEPIFAKAKAPRPRIFEGGPSIGRFTNAFALPRGSRSGI